MSLSTTKELASSRGSPNEQTGFKETFERIIYVYTGIKIYCEILKYKVEKSALGSWVSDLYVISALAAQNRTKNSLYPGRFRRMKK